MEIKKQDVKMLKQRLVKGGERKNFIHKDKNVFTESPTKKNETKKPKVLYCQ